MEEHFSAGRRDLASRESQPQSLGAGQRGVGRQERKHIIAAGVDEPAVEGFNNGPGAEQRKVAQSLAELEVVAGRERALGFEESLSPGFSK